MPLSTLSSRKQEPSRYKDSGPSLSPEKYKKMKHKLREVLEEVDRLAELIEKQEKKINRLKKENGILIERLAKIEDSEPVSNISKPLKTAVEPNIKSLKREALCTDSPNSTKAGKAKRKITNPKTTSEAAPKKRRQKRIEVKPRRVQDLPRNSEGEYALPVQVGVLTVIDLGTIVHDRNTFHNERYIWPVGFTVQRSYASMVDPESQTIYVCKISDGGDGPKFHIEPEDQPDNPIIANTATGAWTTVVKAVNTVRKREHSNSASGPDYFGFSHPTIAKMIQDMPNADKCQQYIWQQFIVMAGRGPGSRKATNASSDIKSNGKNRQQTSSVKIEDTEATSEVEQEVIGSDESEPEDLELVAEQPPIRHTHGGKKPLSSIMRRGGGFSSMSSNDDSEDGSESESELSE